MTCLLKLGVQIQEERERIKLSQWELAEQLDINYSHLCRIEAGERFPGIEYIPPIARFLGRSVSDVIELIMLDRKEVQDARLKPAGCSITSYMQPIESLALRDRMEFLNYVGRDKLVLSEDLDLIPKVLCGLKVWLEEKLYDKKGLRIYAGLYPGNHTYRDESNVIAVSTRKVRGRKGDEVSEKTLMFHILHELGHYRIHWQRNVETKFRLPDEPVYCSSGDRSKKEFQANAYASSFLMPRKDVLQMIGNRRTVNMHKESQYLCDQLLVEPWMLKFRLNRLHIRFIE